MAEPRPPQLPLSRTKARNCAFLNQLGTPGLGSLLAGRILVGIGQLLLAIAGFGFIVAWFAITIIRFYRMMELNSEVAGASPIGLGICGAALFIVAWLWSLVTSISLLRHATEPSLNPPARQ